MRYKGLQAFAANAPSADPETEPHARTRPAPASSHRLRDASSAHMSDTAVPIRAVEGVTTHDIIIFGENGARGSSCSVLAAGGLELVA